MKISALVENTSHCNMPVEHGLSLHIGLDNGTKILFDMGQGSLFMQNAEKLHIDISMVNIAVISHGHYDHGGGLRTFLQHNQKAKVYVHINAFEKHYSLRETGMTDIGLETELQKHPQLFFCEGTTLINDNLQLYGNVKGSLPTPKGNRLLYGPNGNDNDDFCHEQSLLIREKDKTVLFAGCAHTGILNILKRVYLNTAIKPSHVFAGFHLLKSGLNQAEEIAFLQSFARELKNYNHTKFFTMHCTGTEQFQLLHKLMGEQIEYLSCGESVVL
ncbi:MAG: MBL fold metallo-hydrolase [Paludibacteraceae bacterium]|nr:MBL fold metallo-hydrolase [Paludibacteraceae bacterium]